MLTTVSIFLFTSLSAVIWKGETCGLARDFADNCEPEGCSSEEQFSDHSSTEFLLVQERSLQRSGLSKRELMRSANQMARYLKLTSSSHFDIVAKLNDYAAAHPSVDSVVPCSNLNAGGVSLLASELKPQIDISFTISLPRDDGRQIHMTPWGIGAELDNQAHRDALCAETMKLWAHHVRKELLPAASVVLPSLPAYNHAWLGLGSRGVETDMGIFNKSLSYIAGHTLKNFLIESMQKDPQALMQKEPPTFDWPRWPSITHFRSQGHGSGSFLQFGNPHAPFRNLSLRASDLSKLGDGVEVWHNTFLGKTKLLYSSCQLGQFGFPQFGTSSCAVLLLGSNGTTYVHTTDTHTKALDEQFCCKSTSPFEDLLILGLRDHNFMDKMIYAGEFDFHGNYHDGHSKRYIAAVNWRTCSKCGAEPKNVFYETSLDGKPLRLGEFGQNFVLDGRVQEIDLPVVYEEFDPKSFEESSVQSFPDAFFDLPKVCETTLHDCRPTHTVEQLSTFA